MPAPAVYIALDIGGTGLKAAAFTTEAIALAADAGVYPAVLREPSLLGHDDVDAMVARFADFITRAAAGRTVAGVGVSTPGLVHHSGRHVVLCAKHLRPLDNPSWVARLEEKLGAPCALMNDAQSGLCGAVESGLLPRSGTVGFLTFGTGLGFVLWKNGKLWNPARGLPLLGSVRTPAGRFDEIAGVSRLAKNHPSGELTGWLADPACAGERDAYFAGVRGILTTAAILYATDTLIIGGGLVDAAGAAGFSLEGPLTPEPAPELPSAPKVLVARAGNALNLLGAAAFARGLAGQAAALAPKKFSELTTESAQGGGLRLETLPAARLLALMNEGELTAAARLAPSVEAMAPLVDDIAARMERGGRLIYVGAGTSGRLAALDAVEIPCTFGCEIGEVLAIVAGGSPESADTIEVEGEEDASSVPDMLLLRIRPEDTVVGISASGASRQVLTGLAFARSRGALTVLVRAAEGPDSPHADRTIALHSGAELLQGSTRMKAGTATKRVLNSLTTAVMIRRGKVRGTSMIDVACLNEKLRARAVRILVDLYRITSDEGRALLEASGWRMRPVVERLESHRPAAA